MWFLQNHKLFQFRVGLYKRCWGHGLLAREQRFQLNRVGRCLPPGMIVRCDECLIGLRGDAFNFVLDLLQVRLGVHVVVTGVTVFGSEPPWMAIRSQATKWTLRPGRFCSGVMFSGRRVCDGPGVFNNWLSLRGNGPSTHSTDLATIFCVAGESSANLPLPDHGRLACHSGGMSTARMEMASISSRVRSHTTVYELHSTCTSTQTASPNSASSRTFTVWGTKR